MSAVKVLEVPIQGSDAVVEVPVNELPDEVDDLVDILKAEKAELWRWLQFAMEYYRQGKIPQFEAVLKEGIGDDIDRFYAKDKQGRIAILNAHASFKILEAKKLKAAESQGAAARETQQRREDLLTDAVECLNDIVLGTGLECAGQPTTGSYEASARVATTIREFTEGFCPQSASKESVSRVLGAPLGYDGSEGVGQQLGSYDRDKVALPSATSEPQMVKSMLYLVIF